MELVVNNPSIIEEITNLTTIDQFVETIFVEDNKGLIEMQQTIKIDDKLHNISKIINYDLKSTKITIKCCKLIKGKVSISDICYENTIIKGNSNCELLNRHINNIFAFEFSNFEKLNTTQFKFFKQGFFKKIFNKNTETDLLNEIEKLSKNRSWILLPEVFISILENSKNFEKSDEVIQKLIYCIGKFNDTKVYVNSQEYSKIYFGNYDSLTLILNKNLAISENKSAQESFQDTNKITVEYEFIQNSEIDCLEVL